MHRFWFLLIFILAHFSLTASEEAEFTKYRAKITRQNFIQSRYFSNCLKIGIGYSFFSKEIWGGPGFSFEYRMGNILFGTALYRGRTQENTLSRGNYAMMPFYILHRVSLVEPLFFDIGLGTLLVSNEIDNDIIQALNSSGYNNYTESVTPGFYGIIGIHSSIPFLEHYEYSLRYFIGTTTVDSNTSTQPSWSNGADFSQLLLIISYYFPVN